MSKKYIFSFTTIFFLAVLSFIIKKQLENSPKNSKHIKTQKTGFESLI